MPASVDAPSMTQRRHFTGREIFRKVRGAAETVSHFPALSSAARCRIVSADGVMPAVLGR